MLPQQLSTRTIRRRLHSCGLFFVEIFWISISLATTGKKILCKLIIIRVNYEKKTKMGSFYETPCIVVYMGDAH